MSPFPLLLDWLIRVRVVGTTVSLLLPLPILYRPITALRAKDAVPPRSQFLITPLSFPSKF